MHEDIRESASATLEMVSELFVVEAERGECDGMSSWFSIVVDEWEGYPHGASARRLIRVEA